MMSRMVLEDMLTQWGYEVVSVEDGSRAMDILSEDNCPKLIILDWMMPGLDGLEICRKVRAQVEKPYVYILLLTSKKQKADLVEAMEAGADDFISKPPDRNELEMRLRAGKRIITLQDELRHQTTHDFLTGSLNRFAIIGLLEKEMNRATRQDHALSISMVDIDLFKHINDNFGHQSGDAVLCEVVERVKLSLRSYDGVGRYGGEEFLLIFPNSSNKDALDVAEKVRSAISSKPISMPNGTVSVTISLGVSTLYPKKNDDMDTFIKSADEALYAAKKNGRNRVEVAKIRR